MLQAQFDKIKMVILQAPTRAALSVLSVLSLLLVSFLVLDCSLLYQTNPWASDTNETTKQEATLRQSWTPDSWQFASSDDTGESLFKWTNWSTDWWNDLSLHNKDRNWEGRHRMHEKLKAGAVWYDMRVREYFVKTLEARQFPANCTKNFWIVHREHDAGLLSCTHVFFPIVTVGLTKGDGYTTIPVGQAEGKYPPELPTFDGCGPREDKNLRCFFNITSCNIEDDPRREQMLKDIDNNDEDLTGLNWDQMLNRSALTDGMIVLKSFMYDGRLSRRHQQASRGPKLLLWNEIRQRGAAGVHGVPDQGGEKASFEQIDFVIHSMLGSWFLQQTSKNVKVIANRIMSKYSDSNGNQIWTPPVLAVHVRQTDKQSEDPYFQKTGHYRSVDDYTIQMNKLEEEFDFKWQSIFLISDSASAMESLAQHINNIKANSTPDSENGRKGKRFIMYDWNFDNGIIERRGGHTHIPSDIKYSAQEHFLATLYIIGKIADYAIVQYTSNVGRFLSEIIGARHRLSSDGLIGPNAYSVDKIWHHD